MNNFEYSDKEVSSFEMTITITNIIIGVGILTLPKTLAKITKSSDGWISILIAGAAAMLFAWLLAKFAVIAREKHGFFQTASYLITKPAAIITNVAMSVYFLSFGAFETRALADISKHYLFEFTPVEYIALSFLLVVAYSLFGPSITLIRLNTLFLPLVILIAVVVLTFSTGIFQYEQIKPFFITDWLSILNGAKETIFSLLGFESILFYSMLMNKPQDAPKAAVAGVIVPVLLYFAIYVISVGVFSAEGLQQISYPAIELAKEIQFPGEFFERFESIFFIIWVMTIFNTTTMAMDLSIHTMQSVFPSTTRRTWIYIACPVLFLISMIPQNDQEFAELGKIISYLGIAAVIAIPCLLYGIAKFRGVKGS